MTGVQHTEHEISRKAPKRYPRKIVGCVYHILEGNASPIRPIRPTVANDLSGRSNSARGAGVVVRRGAPEAERGGSEAADNVGHRGAEAPESTSRKTFPLELRISLDAGIQLVSTVRREPVRKQVQAPPQLLRG